MKDREKSHFHLRHNCRVYISFNLTMVDGGNTSVEIPERAQDTDIKQKAQRQNQNFGNALNGRGYSSYLNGLRVLIDTNILYVAGTKDNKIKLFRQSCYRSLSRSVFRTERFDYERMSERV